MLNKRHKAYLKLNIISILFTVISFISATLAWFAYSGLVAVKTEVGVRAWYIEFEKDNEVVSNDIVMAVSDIYPGMETVSEVITIKNLGDSDARIKYSISEARLLDNDEDYYKLSNDTTSEYIEDTLSHNYPFHINIGLSKYYLEANEGEATFEVSISWPLDSGDDILDSTWGREAFIFENNERERQNTDPNYQIQPSIKVVINVQAEQVVDDSTCDDKDYQLGTTVLYDIENNQRCTEISDTCLKTHVLDTRNLNGDTTVRLLPDIKTEYASATYDEYLDKINELKSKWNVEIESLTASAVLKVISTDVNSSYLKRLGVSDLIIGDTKYSSRVDDILEEAISSDGYFTYLKEKFLFIDASECVWTADEYNDKAYALMPDNSTDGKLFGLEKMNICRIVPVIIADKSNL